MSRYQKRHRARAPGKDDDPLLFFHGLSPHQGRQPPTPVTRERAGDRAGAHPMPQVLPPETPALTGVALAGPP